MESLLHSPSALLFGLILVASIALQIIGDIRELQARRRNPRYKVPGLHYLPDQSMVAALITSNQQLRNFRLRAIDPLRKHAQRKLISPKLHLNVVSSASALIILGSVWMFEGYMATIILATVSAVVMVVIGLLAWHPSSKISRADKLAIALLAPFSLFVR